MVLVKPATVIQWHRQGFRLFWRWRSRPGRPSVERQLLLKTPNAPKGLEFFDLPTQNRRHQSLRDGPNALV